MVLPFSALTCDQCQKEKPRVGQRVVEYELHMAEQVVNLTGKASKGLTVNGSIPGPTLRFKEGDFARIHVFNNLKRDETSVHWHGLLLPSKQDGVPHISTSPIRPGQKHTFQFTLKHSGTYWYHSHTSLQEQSGVYGGIIVEPSAGEALKADREQILILSDWFNWSPYEIMRMLMRGSDYFGLMRRNAQSILTAWKHGHLKDYFKREWERMQPMDISDVGYHAFLINGQKQTNIPGRPGERVRLRVVNASAATYFYLHYSAGPVTIVAADGPAVQPVKVERLLIAIAETYDLLITIPASGRYEFRATAQDGSGYASAWLGSGVSVEAKDPPKPNLYQMDEMLNLALEEQEDNPRASLQLPRPGSPYRLLRAVKDTSLPKGLPRRKITLHLTGDMNRYIWSFDGKTIAQQPYVLIRRGEVIQLELINDTMMHHPIHLHGHFFRLLLGQDKYSPLKHTVDIPPMSTRTVEFEANEAYDWMFHCHILYHMMSGMARVFRYEEESKPKYPESKNTEMPMNDSLGEHGHDMAYVWGSAAVMSHMTEGLLNWMNPQNDVQLAWELGWQQQEDLSYEIDLLYQRYFNTNFQTFVGYRFTNDSEAEDRFIAGINYRLPLMVWANVSVDSSGDGRLQLAKRLQLTPRLGLWGRVFYDTNTQWDWASGADYTLNRYTSLAMHYHSDFGLGAGLLLRF